LADTRYQEAHNMTHNNYSNNTVKYVKTFVCNCNTAINTL